MIREMVMVNRRGLMALFMKDNGRMVKQMVMASSCTQTVISTKASGLMTKPKDMAHTTMQMEQCTEVIGCKISSMARVLKRGLMEHAMREAIHMVRSTVRAGLLSPIAPYIEVNSIKTKSKGSVVITGQIKKLTSVDGSKTR